MTYPYGTKGAPVVGNGLGGLPRRAIAGGGTAFAARTSSNFAIPGNVLWRNTVTGDRVAAGPISLSNPSSAASLAGVYLSSIRTSIASSLPTAPVAIAHTAAGRLVVIGRQSGTNFVSFCILNPDGTVFVPVTVIANETPVDPHVAVSPNGNIVFVWALGSNPGKFAIYSDVGSQVVAPFQFASVGFRPRVACDSSNNFVISYGNANAFTAFQRFNASGSQITAETLALAQVNNNTSSWVTFLSNGNFVIVAPDDSNGRTMGALFTSTGSSITIVTPYTGGTSVGSVYVSAAPSGGDWVVAWSTSGVVQFARYNGSTLQGTVTTLSPTTSQGAFVQYFPSGSFLVGGCATSGTNLFAAATYTSLGVKVTGSEINTNAYAITRQNISLSPLTNAPTLAVIRSGSIFLYDFSPEFTSGNYLFDGISNFSGLAGPAYVSGFVTIPETLGGGADHRSLGGSAYAAFGPLAAVTS